MTAAWILKVFVDTLEERRDPLQGVQVIAAVSDAFTDTEQDLVTDIVNGLNGQTFRLADLGKHGIAGKTTNRSDLKAGVTSHLRNAIPPKGDIKWATDKGTVTASFGPGRDQNDSAPTVLGAAVLPFAEETLGASEIVAVVWDDDALDPQSAAAVWNILMGFAGQHVGRLKRLYLFAGGQFRSALHTDGLHPARYWVHGGATDEIKRPSHLTTRVETLKTLCDEGKPLVLFLGAGFSMTSGDDPQHRLPLGNDLRDQALEDMFGHEGTKASRLTRFYEVVFDAGLWTPWELARGTVPSEEEFLSDLTLERVLLVEFESRGTQTHSPTLKRLVSLNDVVTAAPSVGVRRLGDLVRAGMKLVLLTVNFDTLIETVCGDTIRTISSPDGLDASHEVIAEYLASTARPGSAERQIPLLKLHGSIDDLETVVADVKSVATGLPDGVATALSLLRDPKEPIPWVFVGHSMRDRDLVPLIEQRDFALGTHELWVSPGMPEPVRTFAADCRFAFWGERGLSIRHATVTSDRFFSELHQRMAS